MKIGKEGIDDCDLGTSAQLHPFVGVILGRAVQPHAVEHDVVSSGTRF